MKYVFFQSVTKTTIEKKYHTMGKRTEEEKKWNGYKRIVPLPIPNYKTTPTKNTTSQSPTWLKHLS